MALRPQIRQSSTVPSVLLSPDEEPSSPASSSSSVSSKQPSIGSSSALKPTPKSLSLRAGSPQYDPTAHESRAGLLIVPEGDTVVEVSDEEDGSMTDAGYEGGIKSGRQGFKKQVATDEQQQRDYLAGPDDELVERMPRPSPLSRSPDPSMDHLDAPAIDSAECTPLPSPSIQLNDDLQLPRTRSAPNNASNSARYSHLADSTPSRPRPRAFTLSHSAFGSSGSFPATARAGPVPAPTLKSRFKLFFLQLFANLASAAFLGLIVHWALASQALNWAVREVRGQNQPQLRRKWDTDEKEAKDRREKVVKDIRYYAQTCGFDVLEEDIETKDGYLLKMFKVECLHKPSKLYDDGRRGFPVLIQHGLFQSCGSFITSEERSLAFWLAEHGGYQVYLGNSRGVFDMGHVQLKRSDPRFWDYNIKELALYDLPAMVDHVRRDTGYDKVAFIGHSQGNATMFCSLAQGMVPELGEKLSLFIALAPAVYAGPLTTGFPFTALKSMKWKTWRRWFGVLDFIPLMRISYDLVPSKPFGLLGYQMFAFLFNWTDTNWLNRRKPKMFRFTPSPVSSASIFWWTGYGGFSTRGCVLDPTVPKWYDHRFPPLSIHHGGKDYLVLTEPLLERLAQVETDVNVIRVQKLDEGEHCDAFWHIDAVELCFESFLEDIEATRPRYPEEEDEQDRLEQEEGRRCEEDRLKGLSVESRRVEEKAKANGLGLGEVRRKVERLVNVDV